jgi:hypothetical protein
MSFQSTLAGSHDQCHDTHWWLKMVPEHIATTRKHRTSFVVIVFYFSVTILRVGSINGDCSDVLNYSRMRVKRSGKVRLCIDPQPLNKSLKRNHYPLPTIEDVLPLL